MNRKEFLKSIGFGAAAAMAVSSLELLNSCMNQNGIAPSGKVDFTIDINNAPYTALKSNGGYIVKDGVVIARTDNGSFAAVTVVCSHQGNPYIYFDPSTNEFACPVHGARYSTTGKGLNSFGSNGLKTYSVEVTGTQLHVYG